MSTVVLLILLLKTRPLAIRKLSLSRISDVNIGCMVDELGWDSIHGNGSLCFEYTANKQKEMRVGKE